MLTDVGLLILRCAIGLVIAAHGAQKLFGWFGGQGLASTANWFGAMALRPAMFWAAVAGVAEFGGGLLIALGLLGPVGPALVFGTMLVAIVTVHWPKGFWNANGGGEFPGLLGVTALALAFIGHGDYSVDHLLGIELPSPETQVVALLLALAGAATCLLPPRLPVGRRAPARA